MAEQDVESVLQGARERYPHAQPRIISDNSPQLTAKDFKEFIRFSGMTHVRTSPYYPQSNGKLECYHRSPREGCIRRGTPLTLEEAQRLIRKYVTHFNEARLHRAIDCITPKDKLEGQPVKILQGRDRKL